MIDEKMIAAIESRITKTDNCWEWQGTMSFKEPRYCTTRKGVKVNIQVRRYIYQNFIGQLQKELVVKTSCGNPKCVNPKHLELNTISKKQIDGQAPRKRKEQCAAITHCPQGHEYAGYNLIEGVTHKKVTLKDGTKKVTPYPSRWCRTCVNARNQQYRARRAATRAQLK